MSDDTPTQRFPSQDDAVEDLQEEKQKSRGLLIGLIIAGALLVVAIIVLVIFLVTANRNDQAGSVVPTPTTSGIPTPEITVEASTSPTPTPTPSPSESESDDPPPPPPPSNTLAIDSYKVSNTTVYCNTQAPGGPFNQYISFSWKTSNADSIKLGTYDPYGDYSDYYVNLPPDGNTNDLGLQITYGCPEPSQKWRLTITSNGQTVKQEIKITNKGDTQ